MVVTATAPLWERKRKIGKVSVGRWRRAWRWNPARCVPLVVAGWLIGGLMMAPLVLYLMGGAVR